MKATFPRNSTTYVVTARKGSEIIMSAETTDPWLFTIPEEARSSMRSWLRDPMQASLPLEYKHPDGTVDITWCVLPEDPLARLHYDVSVLHAALVEDFPSLRNLSPEQGCLSDAMHLDTTLRIFLRYLESMDNEGKLSEEEQEHLRRLGFPLYTLTQDWGAEMAHKTRVNEVIRHMTLNLQPLLAPNIASAVLARVRTVVDKVIA